MSPSRPLRARYWKINQLVPKILEENAVANPPVPIGRIVRSYGISILEGDLGEVSGILVRNSEELIIGVNRNQSKERQKFTMAHELGHYLLHEGISSHFDRDYRINLRSPESSQATDTEEIEANYFAASLLMPASFLEADNAVDALDSDIRVKELARHFGVSRHAMSLRLANVYGTHRPF